MKIKSKSKKVEAPLFAKGGVLKFQEGGAMPAGAPAPEGGGDPIMELLAMAQQALETGDCEAAMATCEGFMMLAGGAGGGTPAEGGMPPEEAPVFGKGGVIKKK